MIDTNGPKRCLVLAKRPGYCILAVCNCYSSDDLRVRAGIVAPATVSVVDTSLEERRSLRVWKILRRRAALPRT